ncbi:MAG TPA: 3-oxoadipyl-CoA thiolase, partial [Streptosporangiaceae bacterium]|nr:3-oxoadipyl-CoA thiolase [Streptosporangiaceae bacterium]
MSEVFVVDACRTPIGKIKGALAGVRPDHLAADVIKALVGRNPALDVAAIDDVYWGAANQAGEADICLAGGSESMTRAPFVVARSADPFPRALDLADTR